jgi:hypothetical protein
MTEPPRSWHLTRSTPTRADAESLFVATTALPLAVIGDRVSISGNAHDRRWGTVVGMAEHDDQSFLRVQLDE